MRLQDRARPAGGGRCPGSIRRRAEGQRGIHFRATTCDSIGMTRFAKEGAASVLIRGYGRLDSGGSFESAGARKGAWPVTAQKSFAGPSG